MLTSPSPETQRQLLAALNFPETPSPKRRIIVPLKEVWRKRLGGPMSNCNTTIVSRLMAINKLEIEAEKQRKRMLKTYKYSESPSLKKTAP